MGRRKASESGESVKKVEIPLFDMLNAIDNMDTGFYDRLSQELKDAFNPWIAMRYASSCEGVFEGYYLVSVNDLVNKDFSLLNKHPELVWKSLCLCGAGSRQRHTFIPPGKRRRKNKLQAELSKNMPVLKLDELELLISVNTEEEIRDYFVSCGYSDSDIDELIAK